MNCTGCGSEPMGFIELESGDYPLCDKCHTKFKKTGTIPVDNLISHISSMIDKVKKRRGNKAHP